MNYRAAITALLAVLSPWTTPVEAIEIKEVMSPAGITAWLVEDHSNPIITMNIAFRGGSALDPSGKEGLSVLAASTLDEGAGDLDSQAFQRKLEDLSISLSFDSGRDTFTGSLRTLTQNSAEAYRLFRMALTNPRFDPEAVERIRQQILAGLRRSAEDPRTIANGALMHQFFPDHPYGRPRNGTLETVPLIKLADLRTFQQQRIARNNLVIGIVGDITVDQTKGVLDELFGSLPKMAAPWKLPEVEARPGSRTIIINKPVPQSIIRFGHSGIKRDDPDFLAAYLMNYLLGGGGFESRLYEEVRNKRGLAYSAWSYLSPMNASGLVLGGAGTANARAAETIEVLHEEWRRMADKGVSAEELEDAKTYLCGSYPLRFTSSKSIASILVGIQLQHLGIDYIQRRNKLITSVSQANVNRVAKKLLKPDGITLVVVGKPKNVQAQP
ncbi:MAG: pitrilysin family protein [Pseudomonadota bacterium]|nr:pitrilysin family protein [Pseudomonadota bacterium]